MVLKHPNTDLEVKELMTTSLHDLLYNGENCPSQVCDFRKLTLYQVFIIKYWSNESKAYNNY